MVKSPEYQAKQERDAYKAAYLGAHRDPRDAAKNSDFQAKQAAYKAAYKAAYEAAYEAAKNSYFQAKQAAAHEAMNDPLAGNLYKRVPVKSLMVFIVVMIVLIMAKTLGGI